MAKKTRKASGEAKTEKSEGVNKSQFIRDTFQANPKFSAKEVQEAWKAAGHTGDLGTPLIYLVKSKAGLRKGRRGRKPRGAMVAAEGGHGVGISDTYLQIEAELDKLIARSPDAKTADALRNARRRASAKLV